ncbi:hypothetical protein MCERE19_00107 [Spirosomataceae bacterium]
MPWQESLGVSAYFADSKTAGSGEKKLNRRTNQKKHFLCKDSD